MDIAIIGAGYVGLVTGGGLANLGHRVRLGEANAERVELLRKGGVPIYEQGLPDLLSHATERGLLSFHTSNKEAVDGAGFVFLALPTPEGDDGRADLKYVHAVVDELANEVDEDTIFVVKSTVPPGTVASLGNGWPTSAARPASSPTRSSSVRARRSTISSSLIASWSAHGMTPMHELSPISTGASMRRLSSPIRRLPR